MKLETKRLMIRPFKMSDDFDLFEMCCDPDTAYNAGWSPHENLKMTRNVIIGYVYGDETMAIVLKSEKKVIGTISLYKNNLRKDHTGRELGFCINKEYRNNGYIKEAIFAMLEYGFKKLNLELIMVCHHDKNFACKKVLESFPFMYEGKLRMYRRLCDGNMVDAVMYSMKKEEFWRYEDERNEA